MHGRPNLLVCEIDNLLQNSNIVRPIKLLKFLIEAAILHHNLATVDFAENVSLNCAELVQKFFTQMARIALFLKSVIFDFEKDVSLKWIWHRLTKSPRKKLFYKFACILYMIWLFYT